MKRNQGFSLIEALIAVIILTLVAVTYASLMLVQNKQEAKVDFRQIETKELSQLYYGMKAYMAKNPAAITATTQPFGILTLIADGELPAGFATRGGAVGSTPWRQSYVIYARNDPTDGKPRAVIYEGTPAAATASLARAGVPNTTVGIAALKADIATKVASTYQIPAATIADGTQTAVGTLNAFTKDLTGLLPGAMPAGQPSAAVLVGFPDLEPPDLTPPGSKWGNCTFVAPFASAVTPFQPAVCPAGTQNLVHVSTPGGNREGFPYCRMNMSPTQEPSYTIYPTDIGNITLGQAQTSSGVGIILNWTGYSCGGGGCSTYQPIWQTYNQTFIAEQAMMNGALVYSTPTCWSSTFYQAHLVNPSGYSQCDPTTNFNAAVGAPTPPNPGCAVNPKGPDASYTAAGQNARVLLCCQQLHP